MGIIINFGLILEYPDGLIIHITVDIIRIGGDRVTGRLLISRSSGNFIPEFDLILGVAAVRGNIILESTGCTPETDNIFKTAVPHFPDVFGRQRQSCRSGNRSTSSPKNICTKVVEIVET